MFKANRKLTFLLIFFCFGSAPIQSFEQPSASSPIYKSTTPSGHLSFTDQKIKTSVQKVYTVKTLTTTKWKKPLSNNLLMANSNKQKLNKAKTEKVRLQQQRATDCEKKISLMKKLENQLNQTQKIRVFDQYKQQLSQLRWQYRSSCI